MGALQTGGNRVAVGLVKRDRFRVEMFNVAAKLIRSGILFLIGGGASPHGHGKMRDWFERTRAA